MKKILLPFLLALHLNALAQVKAGQECFPQRNEKRLVYDVADVLDDAQEDALEKKLDNFSLSTSNQFLIVIVPDICGMQIQDFATELGEEWGVGQGKQDNGAVLVVKPKTDSEKGQYSFAIGRGLEAVIPDGKTYLIAQHDMLPYFKQNDYYGGLEAATNVMMELAKGEYNMEMYEKGTNHKELNGPGWIGFIFFILIFVLFFWIRSREVRRYSRRNNIGFWAAWALLNAAGRSHRSYYNNFNRNSGGFGGWGGGGSSGGGGGFGGFGGGSFGGGGSSGSW